MPRDIELEKKVLGSMLISKKVLDESLFKLNNNDFYDPKNKIIYSAIKNIYESNTSVDVVSIAEYISSAGMLSECNVVYINDVVNSDFMTSNTEDHIKVLKDKSLRRKILEQGQLLINTSVDPSHNMDSVVIDTIDSLSTSVVSDSDNSFLGAYNTLVSDVSEFKESGREYLGMSTGLNDLSKVINGIRTNALIGYVAYSSHGKSWDGLNIMLNLMKQGKKVCFISLEQSKAQLLARLAGIMAGVDDEDIQMGRTPVDKKQAVKEAIDFIKASGSTIYLESDFDNIKKVMFIELKKDKPDMYYLDYIQNVSNKKSGSVNDKLEEVIRYFQEFCVKNDVPMWFASQMNRATHNMKGSEEDGSMGHKSCGQIGASSSVTIMKRIDYTAEEIAYRRDNGIPLESTWHIIKNRDGRGVGQVKMWFNPITHKLYNYELFDKEYGYGKYLSEVASIPDEIREAKLSENEKLKKRFEENTW